MKYYQDEQKFWDKMGAEDYISLSEKDQNKLINWIKWGGNGRILDIGGGSGMMSRLLNDSEHTDCYCLDISHAMLKHAPVDAIQGDALSLPFSSNTFDLIIAAAFFHHLPSMERELLEECYRVLSPGGRIVGYDPNAHCIQNRVFMSNNFLRLSVFSPDERPIEPDLLKKYVCEIGFIDCSKYLFSFRNKRLTFFEFIQRYIINHLSRGPLKLYLERWFFWEATKQTKQCSKQESSKNTLNLKRFSAG